MTFHNNDPNDNYHNTILSQRQNTNLARKRAYRGFTSSISNLFDDERVTCSAVACFGVLASMKTEYLLRQAHPVRGTARRERPQSNVVWIALVVTITLFSLTYLLLPNNGYSSRVSTNQLHSTSYSLSSSIFSPVEHRSLQRICGFKYQVFISLDRIWNLNENHSRKNRLLEEEYDDIIDDVINEYDDDQEDEIEDVMDYLDEEAWSIGEKVRLLIIVIFLIVFGTVGRRRRSRTRYFMMKAKLYDDRLYGRDLPAVAMSSSRSDVSEIARTLSTDQESTFANFTREEYKKWQREVAKCEETAQEASVSHALCGCYPTDLAAHQQRSDVSTIQTEFIEQDILGTIPLTGEGKGDNQCKLAYRFFSALCCGRLFQKWVQCCGVCALAQEARETKFLVPKARQRIDHLTFQGWWEYEGQLDALRQSKNMKFMAHLRSISTLSRYILFTFFWSTLLAVLTVYLTVENFGWGNGLVLFLTFLMSFIVIYLLQWYKNRLDLSLDATIKLFCAGFVLAVPTAYMVEGMIEVTILSLCGMAYLVLSLVRLESLIDRNLYTFILIGELINAYVIAATVEEVTKYLVYRSVEHPDILLAKDHNNNQSKYLTDIKCRARCIQIAMVIVALGLACAENVLYVYLAGGTQVQNEIFILIARSIFPVHAMCAAMQSIGVIERDILFVRTDGERDDIMNHENEEKGLGQILLPSILLHGTFDAVLMVMGGLEAYHDDADDDNYDGNQDNSDNAWDAFAWFVILSILCASVIWLVKKQRDIRDRLERMYWDNVRNGDKEEEETGPVTLQML